MLQLDNHLKLDSAAIKAPNLCDRFSDEDLVRIGSECKAGFERDEQSRVLWMKRNEAGMDLALQIQKDKSFPWAGCANVAFPLVTIAAMQFHARAYPAIVNGEDIVKCKVFGDDPTGAAKARSDRVSTHMSWQVLYQDKCWEEQEDKAIFNLSIVGTNFKKSYYNPSEGHNVSELVLAKNFTLNYWAKSVEKCPQQTSQKKAQQDNRQGVTAPMPDDTTSLMFMEQHTSLDLDGDGYAEPYIITFEKESSSVVRIVTRFDDEKAIERVAAGPNKGKILCINPTEYFTKKTFIPSPDGGIYDIGFGVFLGPLNEAVNSLVNMLLDSGTLQTTAGGFLGRGAKIRGGQYTVAPFEWKRVDSTGDDLRKNIFPLPVNAPSDVLFQLLSLLINYTSRISGTTDVMVGENPGQNTPAQTTQTMVEMGQKIYTAIFKRLWRSSKEEFQKLFKLNSIFLAPGIKFVGGATREDYYGVGYEISPVADPNISSDTAKLQLAGTLKQAAATTPGYNKDAVEMRFLRALHVDAPKEVFPGSQGQEPPKAPQVQVAEIREQGAAQRQQLDLQAAREEFVVELMEERRMNDARITELSAKAQNEAANAQTEAAYAQVAIINAELSQRKTDGEAMNKRIEHWLRIMELKSEHQLRTKELEKAKKDATAK